MKNPFFYYEDLEQQLAARKREAEQHEAFQILKAQVEQMPELALDLEPSRHMFHNIYASAIFPGHPGMPDRFTLTIPFDDIDKASPEFGALLVAHGKVKANTRYNKDRYQMPWSYVGCSSRAKPEVYTLGHVATQRSVGRPDNAPQDLEQLVMELQILEACNLPKDRLFRDRTIRVHLSAFAYWAGPRGGERQGVGLAPTKIGVRL